MRLGQRSLEIVRNLKMQPIKLLRTMIWTKFCSVLFLSLNLMFTGCKSQPNEEVYISDFYNIHEEYKDAWGNVGKYDISLPYIHCDSKSAKKLNQTIKNEYKDLVDSLCLE